jgi:spermidine/putrescine transport system ATP-binding protein
MSAAVVIDKVTKQFSSYRGETPVLAVDHIDLTIENGEFFSMLGPSGCGKTTTLRMIAGFEDVTSGRILIEGQDVVGIPPFHRPVNTVFQDYALFPHMTVEQNIAFGLEMERVPRATIKEEVKKVLDMVQLNNMNRRYPRQLSGGQQQRVALARALVKKPKVLLLDEPLGALDLKLRKQMQLELKHMQRRLGITFIYVTHDQEEALTMSDRIAVMHNGKVLQCGTATDIYDCPTSKFVADFIGETNFLPANIVERKSGTITVQVPGQGTLSVESVHAFGDHLNNGDKVTVAIRPEKVELRPANGTAPDSNCLKGQLDEMIFVGTDTRYVVTLDDAEKTQVVARVQNGINSNGAHAVGSTVQVYYSPKHALILTK